MSAGTVLLLIATGLLVGRGLFHTFRLVKWSLYSMSDLDVTIRPDGKIAHPATCTDCGIMLFGYYQTKREPIHLQCTECTERIPECWEMSSIRLT